MNRLLIACAAAFALSALATSDVASAQKTLPLSMRGQIAGLAAELQSALEEHAVLAGKQLSIGEFTGEDQAKYSNCGLWIESEFKNLLADVINERSKYRLTGSYLFDDASTPSNRGLKVLLISAQVKDALGKEILSLTREVNDTDDIARAMGHTGGLPNSSWASHKERNEVLVDAIKNPGFSLTGHHVAASGVEEYSVGVRKKKTFDGKSQPVTPEDVGGLAYVELGPKDYYEIELTNSDVRDVVATVTVDGLDVANFYSQDKTKYPGYYVAAGKTVVIRGWLRTVKPNAPGGNLLSFLVTKLGEGVSTSEKVRGNIGVITVQFQKCCDVDDKLARRGLGETSTGEGLQAKLTPKLTRFAEDAASTVSIRYNRPDAE